MRETGKNKYGSRTKRRVFGMKVLYAGSFNPWHNGHQYVYDEACRCFGKDNVYVGIAKNSNKKEIDPKFLQWTINPMGIKSLIYDGLTATFCKENGFNLIVRGIRNEKDTEHEYALSYWNERLGDIKTIWIPSPNKLKHISSSIIREICSYNKNACHLNMMDYSVWLRWRQERKYKKYIYFGKSCVGKSTYIRSSLTAFDTVLNCDEAINKYDGPQSERVRRILFHIRESFNAKDVFSFNYYTYELGTTVDWAYFFKNHDIIDAPNIGTYFRHIPKEIIINHNLVKLTTSSKHRERNREHRGMPREAIEYLDSVYVDPPFFDEEIDITETKEN